ncbi:MAG: KpsF/GutQ family sugar-phosphate isomerase [Bdellovibrionales bacterium]|nr:KpsF/GutQ family sugar-phosphate isomerase [Bdellovibrionales bacterium]
MIIDEAKRVLKMEAEALMAVVDRINGDFEEAVQLISQCEGKVIVTGMGKSGLVGAKMASTMTSTGTPSLFMHPAESSHGDLGVIAANDIVIAISNQGESEELFPILNYLARKGIPLIAMTGNSASTLAKAAKFVLDTSVQEEACPLGLAPTTSTTVTLAMGDALAMSILKQKGFKKENYAELHPGGSLGRRLLTKVKDVMHTGEALPLVREEDQMSSVVSLMTSKEVRGVAGVVNDDEEIIGIITDGDIRRRLEKSQNPFVEKAKDLMSKNPKTIEASELAEKALFLMEQFTIQTLFVVDKKSNHPKRPVGLLHLQDLLKAKIR